MKKTVREMVVEFRLHWKNYVFQSALATVVLLLALWVMKANQMVLVASLGATAFIVFALPDSPRQRGRGTLSAATWSACSAAPSATCSRLRARPM